MECGTIDKMIGQLEIMKKEFGGDCRVLIEHWDELRVPDVFSACTGKSNDWKMATRGGNPCIIITRR